MMKKLLRRKITETRSRRLEFELFFLEIKITKMNKSSIELEYILELH